MRTLILILIAAAIGFFFGSRTGAVSMDVAIPEGVVLFIICAICVRWLNLEYCRLRDKYRDRKSDKLSGLTFRKGR